MGSISDNQENLEVDVGSMIENPKEIR